MLINIIAITQMFKELLKNYLFYDHMNSLPSLKIRSKAYIGVITIS